MGSNIPGGACTTHLAYRGFEVELRLYQSVPGSCRVTCESVRNGRLARRKNRHKRSAPGLDRVLRIRCCLAGPDNRSFMCGGVKNLCTRVPVFPQLPSAKLSRDKQRARASVVGWRGERAVELVVRPRRGNVIAGVCWGGGKWRAAGGRVVQVSGTTVNSVKRS